VLPTLSDAVCAREVAEALATPGVLVCLVALATVAMVCAASVIGIRILVSALLVIEAGRAQVEEFRAAALIRAADAITTASLRVGLDRLPED
jgi:hypothetical protein